MTYARFTKNMECHLPNRIALTLTETYAESWKTWEGVREFVQNWFDGIFDNLEGSPGLKPKFTKGEGGNWYEATVSHGDKEVPLGSLIFSEENRTLTLVNSDTTLQRKVLLMGYSKKASRPDVIGQFGEGLKVGALALIRCGIQVAMVTSCDRWRFKMDPHPYFKDNVLTVFLSDRTKGTDNSSLSDTVPLCPVSVNDGDTCVQIWPISRNEWDHMSRRFLFLEPPQDSVHTELGTILLDSYLQGQLFVKQVWVSDQKKDGLSVGVDFKHLRIDRDRRAVIHQSDIDHQVSSMWVRALKIRPDLAPRYFELLQQNESCDVRHASYYLDDNTTAQLVASEFFKQHGDNAIPVLNTSTSDTLQMLRGEVEEKVVLCNQALVEILQKSGRVRTLESVLQEKAAHARKRVLVTTLTEEQHFNAEHAIKLVNIAVPDVSASSLEFYEGNENNVTYVDAAGKFEVPIWMVQGDMVHARTPCKSGDPNCFCAAAFLCERIMSVCPGGEGKKYYHVIGSLALQVCGNKEPFCLGLHSSPTCVLLQDREEQLQKHVDTLLVEFQKREEVHKKDLETFRVKLSEYEHTLTLEEVRFTEMHQDLIDKFKKEEEKRDLQYKVGLQAKKNEYDALYSEFLGKCHETQFNQIQLQASQHKMEEEAERHHRTTEGLQKQREWYLKRLADKVSKLSDFYHAKGEVAQDSELARLLQRFIEEFQEDQKKEVCLVCTNNPKNCVFLPCKHQHTCAECAPKFPNCPVCRRPVDDRMQVYV